MTAQKRLLVFAVARDREAHLAANIDRIASLGLSWTEALLIGHPSDGEALRTAARACRESALPFHLLVNPVDHGAGADHKLALQFALDHDFAVVAPIDGEEAYAAEMLRDLAMPLERGEADAVFGSRLAGDSRASERMPVAQRWVDRLLTTLQNRLIGVGLSEFRPRYRAYSVEALRRVRFDLATNEPHFDTELLVQLQRSGARLLEVAVPPEQGSHRFRSSRARGSGRACSSLFQAWLCEKDLFYDRRFDRTTALTHDVYRLKIGFDSSHSAALGRVRKGSRVLDLGCGNPALCRHFVEQRGCRVTGIDRRPLLDKMSLEAFHVHDLNHWPLPVSVSDYDYVLLLDVLEHLASPEGFLDHLQDALTSHPDTRLVVSVPNVAFFVERIMLLLGRFNYGRRGILDLTHTRLFTPGSIRRLFEQSGFVVEEVFGIPPPYPLAIGHNAASRLLLRLNRVLIGLSVGLFSYQVLLVVRTSPSPRYLLDRATDAAVGHEAGTGERASQAPSAPAGVIRSMSTRSRGEESGG